MRTKTVIAILILIIVIVGVAIILLTPRTKPVPVQRKYRILYLVKGGDRNFSVTNLVPGSFNNPYDMCIFYQGNTSIAVSPFLWNFLSANYIFMNLNFSGLYYNVTIKLLNVSYINPSIHVLGYPGFMYGYESWFPFSQVGKTKESLIYLPQKIVNLQTFYSFLNYSVWNTTGMIDDFSYDIWLTPKVNVTQLEKGDIEIMIWNYWGENLSKVPYFVYKGTVEFPTYINGKIENISYAIYILNYTGSSNGWTGVYYLMENHGVKTGVIGTPITLILQYTANLLVQRDGYIANVSNYYLNAIQVGMETYGNSVVAGYYLYDWWFNIST